MNAPVSDHAPSLPSTSGRCVLPSLPHHLQQELCMTRPKYRQGRKYTAVKVYTVHQESQYILLHNVPSLGLRHELRRLCSKFGKVDSCCIVDGYPSDPFTDVWLVRFARIPAARAAKRTLDGRVFYGGPLHVCYAPECETIEETRWKLLERRRRLMQIAVSNGQPVTRICLDDASQKSSFPPSNSSPRFASLVSSVIVPSGTQNSIPPNQEDHLREVTAPFPCLPETNSASFKSNQIPSVSPRFAPSSGLGVEHDSAERSCPVIVADVPKSQLNPTIGSLIPRQILAASSNSKYYATKFKLQRDCFSSSKSVGSRSLPGASMTVKRPADQKWKYNGSDAKKIKD